MMTVFQKVKYYMVDLNIVPSTLNMYIEVLGYESNLWPIIKSC